MMYLMTGDLLESDCEYICHQVNCQGKMGSGIAKQIRNKWKAVYDMYMNVASPSQLGHIQKVFVKDLKINMRCVVNMFAQEHYGYDGRRYTSYDAFWNCLHELKEKTPKGKSIGFPKGIGCGLGGANWEVILQMIIEVLGNDYDIYIYQLEEEKND